MFPPDLARFLNDFYRQKGVEVLAGERVTGWEMRAGPAHPEDPQRSNPGRPGDRGRCRGGGDRDPAERRTGPGGGAGGGGRHSGRRGLRTSHPDIYAAGDVANFYNPALDRRLRVEHEDNANTMGRLAGQAMAGRAVAYDHLPSFYSDLFELGFEAVGEVDSRLETVADWKEPYREGVFTTCGTAGCGGCCCGTSGSRWTRPGG